MAQRVQVVLVDDFDQSEAQETINFAIDGVSYEIDLSVENAGKLRAAVAPWAEHARRVGGRRNSRKRTVGVDGSSANDIRTWALANGYEVSNRGRVPAEIREAYDRAHA